MSKKIEAWYRGHVSFSLTCHWNLLMFHYWTLPLTHFWPLLSHLGAVLARIFASLGRTCTLRDAPLLVLGNTKVRKSHRRVAPQIMRPQMDARITPFSNQNPSKIKSQKNNTVSTVNLCSFLSNCPSRQSQNFGHILMIAWWVATTSILWKTVFRLGEITIFTKLAMLKIKISSTNTCKNDNEKTIQIVAGKNKFSSKKWSKSPWKSFQKVVQKK